MTLVLSWRFFGAVVVMYVSGLFMAAFLLHSYLIFAVVWWLVLNWIGLTLWRSGPRRRISSQQATLRISQPSKC
jgi:threonine/homoserine/homoserine lactone efflux protein